MIPLPHFLPPKVINPRMNIKRKEKGGAILKRWLLTYLFVGSLVSIVSSLSCLFSLYKPTLVSSIEKQNFESVYQNTSIDFIVPSPSFQQVPELEKSDNGIEKVTPYYSFSMEVKKDSQSFKSNTLIFDDSNKLNYTPYNEARIVKGNWSNESFIAIADSKYSSKSGFSVGDNFSIEINSEILTFKLTAISEDNPFLDGSIALVIPQEKSKYLFQPQYPYGGAYITANNYGECKDYIMSEYKPLGRLKSRSDFDSDAAYETHLKNFNDADWSQEITNMRENYSALSTRYANVDKNLISNMFLISVVMGIGLLVFNLILCFLPSNRHFFEEIHLKKNFSTSKIFDFYALGSFCSGITTIVILSIGMLLMTIAQNPIKLFSNYWGLTLWPLAMIAIVSLLNSLIDWLIVRRWFSVKHGNN